MAAFRRVVRYGVLSSRRERRLASASVTDLAIATPRLATEARTLSGGNQQKVVIGKWLNAQARVLLMDEPTRGIDIHAKEQVYRLILDLAEEGIGVVFVSSELEELLAVCHRVLVLNQGQVLADLSVHETSLDEVLALSMKAAA